MRVVLASGNKGKIVEFEKMLGCEVVPYKELLGDLEIEENGKSFKENALIKARAVYDALEGKERIVLADDSGISVPALGGEPGIYSARYAGEGARDVANLQKLVELLKHKGIERTLAYYTAAIAIATKDGIFTVHGWMWGEVITRPRGNKGFGYDPMFIPEGFDQTLGEMDEEIKNRISHRAKALELAKKVLKVVDGSAKSL